VHETEDDAEEVEAAVVVQVTAVLEVFFFIARGQTENGHEQHEKGKGASPRPSFSIAGASIPGGFNSSDA